MHPQLIAKALAGMEQETTVDQFQVASGIAGRSAARDVLNLLASYNIGRMSKNKIIFSPQDRLSAAVLGIEMGCDIEQVSTHLSWKDFEGLASEVLASLGYKTMTNARFTKPRMEVDVLGVNSGFAVAVDCKHWKRASPSSMRICSQKQAARAEHLIVADSLITQAVPVIMTLHTGLAKFAGGVPVVPVNQFRSFLLDIREHLPEIYVAG